MVFIVNTLRSLEALSFIEMLIIAIFIPITCYTGYRISLIKVSSKLSFLIAVILVFFLLTVSFYYSISRFEEMNRDVNRTYQLAKKVNDVGAFEIARVNYENSLQLAQKFDRTDLKLNTHIALGKIYIQQKDYTPAIDHLSQAIEYINSYNEMKNASPNDYKENFDSEMREALWSWGKALSKIGNFEGAKLKYMEGSEFIRDKYESFSSAEFHTLMGKVLNDQGQISTARDAYRKALQIVESMNIGNFQNDAKARFYNQVAQFEVNDGKLEQAYEYYKAAEEITNNNGYSTWIKSSLLEISHKLNLTFEAHEIARDLRTQYISNRKNEKEHLMTGAALLLAGDIEHSYEHYAVAKKMFLDILPSKKSNFNKTISLNVSDQVPYPWTKDDMELFVRYNVENSASSYIALLRELKNLEIKSGNIESANSYNRLIVHIIAEVLKKFPSIQIDMEMLNLQTQRIP